MRVNTNAVESVSQMARTHPEYKLVVQRLHATTDADGHQHFAKLTVHSIKDDGSYAKTPLMTISDPDAYDGRTWEGMNAYSAHESFHEAQAGAEDAEDAGDLQGMGDWLCEDECWLVRPTVHADYGAGRSLPRFHSNHGTSYTVVSHREEIDWIGISEDLDEDVRYNAWH